MTVLTVVKVSIMWLVTWLDQWGLPCVSFFFHSGVPFPMGEPCAPTFIMPLPFREVLYATMSLMLLTISYCSQAAANIKKMMGRRHRDLQMLLHVIMTQMSIFSFAGNFQFRNEMAGYFFINGYTTYWSLTLIYQSSCVANAINERYECSHVQAWGA